MLLLLDYNTSKNTYEIALLVCVLLLYYTHQQQEKAMKALYMDFVHAVLFAAVIGFPMGLYFYWM